MVSIPTSFHVGINPLVSCEDVHGKKNIMLSLQRPYCNVKIKWCQFKLQFKKKKKCHKDKCLLEPVWLPRANALPSWVEKPVSVCPAVWWVLLPVFRKALGGGSMFHKWANTTAHWGLWRLLTFSRGRWFVPIRQALWAWPPLLTPIRAGNPQVSLNNLLSPDSEAPTSSTPRTPFWDSSPTSTMYANTLPCAYDNDQNCLLLLDFEIPTMIDNTSLSPSSRNTGLESDTIRTWNRKYQ